MSENYSNETVNHQTARPTGAVALYSGGLDSIVSCRQIMAQGVTVYAVRFVTPFFGYELLAREEEYVREVAENYGIDVRLKDISEKYLEMLRNPSHGYGKNFNPCVDCKILIASEARAMMDELGASFMISGEVIGQRPMSQRRDTLRIIEKKSGCEDILLRPLCALNLKETLPEREGLVDRNRLLGFSGRGRQPQMKLAASFGIEDYPSPAGGCVLTDPNKAARIRRFYEENDLVSTTDIRLLMVGRHFRLPGGGWLVLGRNILENDVLRDLCRQGDIVLEPEDWPGPTAILRGSGSNSDLRIAGGIIKGYSKKRDDLLDSPIIYYRGGLEKTVVEKLEVSPLGADIFAEWKM